MYSSIASLILALGAPTALAFQSTTSASTRQSVSLQNALRDMAANPENSRMMSEFEAFDRNGAFSRSAPGMGGRPEMNMNQEMMNGPQMYDPQMMNSPQMMNDPQMMNNGYGGQAGPSNPNPFSRRQGGGNHQSQDGFDPHSAYGNSFGASQSDRRQGMPMGGDPRSMMGTGRGSGQINGVKNDNTMGGFSYSSRNREYQGQMQGGQFEHEGMGGFDGPMDMMGGFDGPMEMMGGFDGPMEMMGGGFDGPMGDMDYQYEQMQQMQQQGGYPQQQQGGFQPQQQQGGFPPQQEQQGGFSQQQQGYGGFEGDVSRMGP